VPYSPGPEYIVSEGLATVFERDYASGDPLWGRYEDDRTMRQWLSELLAQGDSINEDYLFDHPDGRRWIAYKTGAWVVDRVLHSTKVSFQWLTTHRAESVIKLLPARHRPS
jgi:uncharacterized protein YjaZ